MSSHDEVAHAWAHQIGRQTTGYAMHYAGALRQLGRNPDKNSRVAAMRPAIAKAEGKL